jgi:hypothetical protein
MIDLSKDIHPLTNFKRNTAVFVKRMKKSRRPVVDRDWAARSVGLDNAFQFNDAA